MILRLTGCIKIYVIVTLKILLGDFNAKVGREDIFKPTIGNESLHEISNSKNKNIRDLYRGINYFKRGHRPRSNLAKDENGNLLADSHNILNR
jgi:hypothetical protein